MTIRLHQLCRCPVASSPVGFFDLTQSPTRACRLLLLMFLLLVVAVAVLLVVAVALLLLLLFLLVMALRVLLVCARGD